MVPDDLNKVVNHMVELHKQYFRNGGASIANTQWTDGYVLDVTVNPMGLDREFTSVNDGSYYAEGDIWHHATVDALGCRHKDNGVDGANVRIPETWILPEKYDEVIDAGPSLVNQLRRISELLFSNTVLFALVGEYASCLFESGCPAGSYQTQPNDLRLAIGNMVWVSCFGPVATLQAGAALYSVAEWGALPAAVAGLDKPDYNGHPQQKSKYLLRCLRQGARKHFTHGFMNQYKDNTDDEGKQPLLCIGAFALGLALVDSLLMAASLACTGSSEIFDILCLRPFREYTMGSGILLKKGSELGNTFRGWADFQLTDNIIAKTHIGHFTFWHASIVTNPKCLFLAEDIFCTNYVRGEGKTPLNWKYAEDFREDPMGTMQRHDASIICLPIPLGSMDPASHRLSMNNPISLNSKLIEHSEKFGQNTSNVKIGMVSCAQPEYLCETNYTNLEKHYETHMNPDNATAISNDFAAMFNSKWGFDKLNSWVDIESANTFETSGNLINTMCFHTMQKFQNPSNKRWEVTNLNTGHFGENGIYEGVKRIRCGFIDYFKEMDYQKSMAMGGMNI